MVSEEELKKPFSWPFYARKRGKISAPDFRCFPLPPGCPSGISCGNSPAWRSVTSPRTLSNPANSASGTRGSTTGRGGAAARPAVAGTTLVGAAGEEFHLKNVGFGIDLAWVCSFFFFSSHFLDKPTV